MVRRYEDLRVSKAGTAAYRARLRAAGMCRSHKRPARPGSVFCEDCLAKQAANHRAKREQRNALARARNRARLDRAFRAGLCYQCDEDAEREVDGRVESPSRCRRCSGRDARARRRRRARGRRGAAGIARFLRGAA